MILSALKAAAPPADIATAASLDLVSPESLTFDLMADPGDPPYEPTPSPVRPRRRLPSGAKTASHALDEMMKTKLVTIDAEIMSGEPVFTGTRVPVRNLIEYLSAGQTLDDFLEGFPDVKRRQAIAFLKQSSSALLDQAGARRSAA